MKRFAAFAVALIMALSAPACAYALDEDYALDYYNWFSLEGAQFVIAEEEGFSSSLDYYVDEEQHIFYAYLSYCASSLAGESDRVFVVVSLSNGAQSKGFSFDENGFTNYSGTDIKLVQSFDEPSAYGQNVTFAFQLKDKNDFTDNRVEISVCVNGSYYDVLSRQIAFAQPTTEKATTQKSEKNSNAATTKSGTTKPSTAKASKSSDATKFTPPADADYFTSSEQAVSELTEAQEQEYEAGNFVEAPEMEETKALSNPARILLICAAILALTGMGFFIKAAASSKRKRAEEKKQKAEQSLQVKSTKIDEKSKEIIDRYIDDDYDIEG